MEGGIVCCRTEEDEGSNVEGGNVCSTGDAVGTSVVSKFVFSSSMNASATSTFKLMQSSWNLKSLVSTKSSDSDNSSRSTFILSSMGEAAVSTMFL